MTGSRRRLFAAVSQKFEALAFEGLIFVAVVFVAFILAFIFVALILAAPKFLHAQDVAADGASVTAPVRVPVAPPLRYVPPIAPIVPFSPNFPAGYPISPYPAAPGGGVLPQGFFPQGFFPQLVRAAGIIFSGRVTSVGHNTSSQGLVRAATSVTFQVEQAIRGTSPGQMLTIREWGGLWSSGESYRVGERVVLFLYSPGKLGLTSPVAGAMGRFEMDSPGRVVINPQHIATLAADPILGGKTTVPYRDFARAVGRAGGEE